MHGTARNTPTSCSSVVCRVVTAHTQPHMCDSKTGKAGLVKGWQLQASPSCPPALSASCLSESKTPPATHAVHGVTRHTHFPAPIRCCRYCVANAPDTFLGQASTAQMAAFAPAACGGFTAAQLSHAKLTMTASCAKQLQSSACEGINGDNMATAPTATVAGFGQYCVASMQNSAFSKVPAGLDLLELSLACLSQLELSLACPHTVPTLCSKHSVRCRQQLSRPCLQAVRALQSINFSSSMPQLRLA